MCDCTANRLNKVLGTYGGRDKAMRTAAYALNLVAGQMQGERRGQIRNEAIVHLKEPINSHLLTWPVK